MATLIQTQFAHVPAHLRAFISPVSQADYTDIDQQTWATMMSLLLPYWEASTYGDFLPGLAKVGIRFDRIPNIAEVDACLQQCGWRAVPVDGFIPPAAFMEFHALGILPIARTIRKPENLAYTPAPDIVHEAAGHAPLLANAQYGYLSKRFGQLAMKAGFSEHDQRVYEVIRHLSDIKESRTASDEEIAAAEADLKAVYEHQRPDENSIGARLTRLFWWTIEYGLIGTVDDCKIYGSGLISSLGEGTVCLGDSVAKLPLTMDCIDVTFDITQPQPQLFVTADFATVAKLLDEFEVKFL